MHGLDYDDPWTMTCQEYLATGAEAQVTGNDRQQRLGPTAIKAVCNYIAIWKTLHPAIPMLESATYTLLGPDGIRKIWQLCNVPSDSARIQYWEKVRYICA